MLSKQNLAPIGKRVQLTGCEVFYLEIKYDYLYVYDGPMSQNKLIGSLTGLLKSNNYDQQSTGEIMELRFKTYN